MDETQAANQADYVNGISDVLDQQPQKKNSNQQQKNGPVSKFMQRHFLHFNARETVDAAQGYCDLLEQNGKMLVSLAGAMSTAELGISLAEMIRQDKVHAISCTAANLEEDVFNLVAHNEYKSVPNYRNLSAEDELAIRDDGFNRVTDTCIPETVMRHLEREFIGVTKRLAESGESRFPFEIHYELFQEKRLDPYFQIPVENSWLYAAWQKNLPVYSPGFEDSTLANIFAARVIEGKVKSHSAIKTGTEQMEHLVNWYLQTQKDHPIGFFQIGGGIAGDFAICSVPTIIQDLKETSCRFWAYFSQISDSTTSYGSYSGAIPSEKITWFKLGVDTPTFMINSDASIVAPLIFAYVLDQ